MEKQRIVCLGDAGSYGDCVTQWLNGNEYRGEAHTVFAKSNEDVLSLVASSDTNDVGVVPVYNSSAGYVAEVIRWLMRQDDQRQEHLSAGWIANPYLFAMRRISLRIHHQLLGCDPTIDTGYIETVVSHPQALEQCREHLKSLGKVTLKPFSSTASAARWVAEQANPTIAAIASPFCAEIYGLTALEGNFEDDENNYTHFYCFQKCQPLPSKIHLLLSDPAARDALGLLEEGNVRHIVSTGIALLLWPSRNGHGVLHDILSPMDAMKVDVRYAPSIPIGGSKGGFESKVAFFVEMNVHPNRFITDAILTLLAEMSEKMVVLSAFAREDVIEE